MSKWWFDKRLGNGYDVLDILPILENSDWDEEIKMLSNRFSDGDFEIQRQLFSLALRSPISVVNFLVTDAVQKKKIVTSKKLFFYKCE